MAEGLTVHSTFAIERSFRAAPERVFEALADPAKKRKWFVEGEGHKVEHYEMEFRTGGKEVARFRFREGTPVAGLECISEGSYLDIVPERRVVAASTMTIAGRCISAALTTYELVATATGTDLLLTHQGAFFEGSDGPERREHGWQKLLDRLAAEFPAPR